MRLLLMLSDYFKENNLPDFFDKWMKKNLTEKKRKKEKKGKKNETCNGKCMEIAE